MNWNMVTQYAFITTAWFQFVPLLPLKQLNSSLFELFFKSRTILPHHLLLAQFAYFPKISLCHTFPRILPFFYKHHCVSLINQTRPSVLIDIFFFFPPSFLTPFFDSPSIDSFSGCGMRCVISELHVSHRATHSEEFGETRMRGGRDGESRIRGG